jgi:hypothetical protein
MEVFTLVTLAGGAIVRLLHQAARKKLAQNRWMVF